MNELYRKEKYISSQKLDDSDIHESPMIPMSLINQISKCIVCITTSSCRGTGFLCHLPIQDTSSLYYGIMTNNHVLPESELADGNIIHLTSDNEIFKNGESKADIELVPNRYRFTSTVLDSTFISISPSELFTSFNWLNVLKTDDSKKDQPVIIIQHPQGGPQNIAYGSIYEVQNKDIHHLVSTDYGSSGSPLLNTEGYVIGLHKMRDLLNNYNMATKTSEIIKEIENDINSNYSDVKPPEVITAIENARKNLDDFLKQRKLHEEMQIKVFYAEKKQIFGGESSSTRAQMEKKRDLQRDVAYKSEDSYKTALNSINRLVDICDRLNRKDLSVLLLSTEVDLLNDEAENRKERVRKLDDDIRTAKKKQINGGLSSYNRGRLQDMQKNARDDSYKIDQRIADIRNRISSY